MHAGQRHVCSVPIYSTTNIMYIFDTITKYIYCNSNQKCGWYCAKNNRRPSVWWYNVVTAISRLLLCIWFNTPSYCKCHYLLTLHRIKTHSGSHFLCHSCVSFYLAWRRHEISTCSRTTPKPPSSLDETIYINARSIQCVCNKVVLLWCSTLPAERASFNLL